MATSPSPVITASRRTRRKSARVRIFRQPPHSLDRRTSLRGCRALGSHHPAGCTSGGPWVECRAQNRARWYGATGRNRRRHHGGSKAIVGNRYFEATSERSFFDAAFSNGNIEAPQANNAVNLLLDRSECSLNSNISTRNYGVFEKRNGIENSTHFGMIFAIEAAFQTASVRTQTAGFSVVRRKFPR